MTTYLLSLPPSTNHLFANVRGRGRVFSSEDRARLCADYERYTSEGRLAGLAAEMGRTKAFICRQARKLGLTRKGRRMPGTAAKQSATMKAWHATHAHPRGAAGIVFTDAAKAKMAEASNKFWSSLSDDDKADHVLKSIKARIAKGVQPPRRGATWKAAWHVIGGKRSFYRSRWEANYAYYLEWLKAGGHIKEWEHEPETFWFRGIKRGCVSYLPDFRVTENSGAVSYHEVKGWMDDRSKTKIARMAKYHPTVRLLVIASKEYAAIAKKVCGLVPGWDSPGEPARAAA